MLIEFDISLAPFGAHFASVCFFMDFHIILAPFGTHFGTVFGLIFGLIFGVRFLMIFKSLRTPLELILAPFGAHFGILWGVWGWLCDVMGRYGEARRLLTKTRRGGSRQMIKNILCF